MRRVSWLSNQVWQSPHEYAVLLFLAFACALRRRSLPHTVPSGRFTMQRTYLQRSQPKLATSSADAGNCFALTVFIAFVQFGVLHLGSRHVLQVGHLGRNMHGGLEQSWHLVVSVDELRNAQSENAWAGLNMLQVSHLTLCVCASHPKQVAPRWNRLCHIDSENAWAGLNMLQVSHLTLGVCASHSKQQIDRSA